MIQISLDDSELARASIRVPTAAILQLGNVGTGSLGSLVLSILTHGNDSPLWCMRVKTHREQTRILGIQHLHGLLVQQP